MVGFTVYWKKFWGKQPLNEGQEQPLNKDCSMVFTLKEIKKATQNFSQKIGRTSFGSVFFGKLPDGKEIAVKVSSDMGQQAIEEFLNEIDLLSRVHHKNLVTLLGYCIGESGQHMLIYDHLSEGSLRDHLYGQRAGESDGKEIAVKVPRGIEGLTDIDLLSRVHHKNLVTLLGYCIGESGQHMLIYDHMSEGSLTDHLHGQRGLSELNWKSRLKIAIDAAEGLQYLHVCCTPMIIHRDVKTANILLDSDLNGKLGDFGLSMITMDRKAPIDTLVAGTYGYLDPEHMLTGVLTQKSDVYSFGVVLLEIICGRKPIDDTLPEEEKSLPEWVKDYVGINENPGKIVEIIDKKMDGNYGMKSITIVAKLALRCIDETSSCRPSMSEVVGELKEAFMYEKVKLKEAPVAKHK